MNSLLSMTVVVMTCLPISARWLRYPRPGIPRMPNGKPNLSAPAPKTSDRKPDLSGIWVAADGKYLPNLAR